MADRIKGITIELNANTVKLTEALKDVNNRLRSTQSDLNDVNRLLKFDPKNTELLAQKQKLLSSVINDTKAKLDEERKALEQLQASGDKSEAAIKQQDALKREIIATEGALKNYKSQLSGLSPTLQAVGQVTGELAEKTKGFSAACSAGLAGLVGLAVKAGATADDLNTLAKQTGFSTEELQKMQYAADRIDVSMDTITGAAAKLTRAVASGSDAFDTLHVSLINADGSTRSVNEIFYDTIQALSQVQNETDRDTLAMQIFGKSANELAGIIDDGGVALREMGAEAQAAGLILSQDALDAANQFNDAIDELKAKAQAAFLESGATLAENFLPAMENLLEIGGRILEFIAGLDGDTLNMITTLLAMGATISPILKLISGGIDLFGKLSTAMSFISTTVMPALTGAGVAGAGGIAAAFSGLLPVIAAVAAAITGLIALFSYFKKKKWDNEWDQYSTNTSGYHELSSHDAQYWMNKDEVKQFKDPSGDTRYYVKDSDYTWLKSTDAANEYTDSGNWDNPTVVNVNVDHINDLDDLLKIKEQAQMTTRMGY